MPEPDKRQVASKDKQDDIVSEKQTAPPRKTRGDGAPEKTYRFLDWEFYWSENHAFSRNSKSCVIKNISGETDIKSIEEARRQSIDITVLSLVGPYVSFAKGRPGRDLDASVSERVFRTMDIRTMTPVRLDQLFDERVIYTILLQDLFKEKQLEPGKARNLDDIWSQVSGDCKKRIEQIFESFAFHSIAKNMVAVRFGDPVGNKTCLERFTKRDNPYLTIPPAMKPYFKKADADRTLMTDFVRRYRSRRRLSGAPLPHD